MTKIQDLGNLVGQLATKYVALEQKYNALVQEKDALIQEKDSLVQEKDALVRENAESDETFQDIINKVNEILIDSDLNSDLPKPPNPIGE